MTDLTENFCEFQHRWPYFRQHSKNLKEWLFRFGHESIEPLLLEFEHNSGRYIRRHDHCAVSEMLTMIDRSSVEVDKCCGCVYVPVATSPPPS